MTAEGKPETALSVTFKDYADCRVLSISGRVDHTNSDTFLEDLSGHADAIGGGMVLDLSGLDFITSAGLRTLLIAQRTIKSRGAKMAVSGLEDSVRDVFRISKFDALLTVTESITDAVASVSSDARASFPG